MAAKKGENPVLPVLNSPSHMTPSRRWRATDPITPMVSGLVQGIRFGEFRLRVLYACVNQGVCIRAAA